MDFFFFNRKDKLLSKCNNCFNNGPQPPKKLKKKKLENWDSPVTRWFLAACGAAVFTPEEGDACGGGGGTARQGLGNREKGDLSNVKKKTNISQPTN